MPILQSILGHVLDRLFEAEEARAHPGPLRETNVLRDLWDAGRGRSAREQITMEVASEAALLLAIAEGRAKRVRRLWRVHAGQNRGGTNRTAVAFPALDLVSQLRVQHQASGHADSRDE
jgi:hypothetical protein